MTIRIQRRIDAERVSIESNLDALEALLFFTLNLTNRNIDYIRLKRESLLKLTRADAKKVGILVENRIKEIRGIVGATQSNIKFLDDYKKFNEDIGDNKKAVCLQRSFFFNRFNHPEKIFPIFPFSPRHAVFEIVQPPHDGMKEFLGFVVPEVSLFEDMALLFNQAHELHHFDENKISKIKIKQRRGINRACINAALGFVEAYINGVALNCLYDDQKKNSLTDKDLSLLMEVTADDARKQKFVSFREKILQYPKIATGSKFPLIAESNCPEFALLIANGKKFRDAFAHPSFHPTLIQEGANYAYEVSDKTKALINVQFSDVEKTVDAAIHVVLRIDELVGEWIKNFVSLRGDAGLFSEELFL